ncbi:hypothetical protein ACQP1G_45460 [Nocardia sp. CA-107356]
MSAQTRDGATRAELHEIAAAALHAWPQGAASSDVVARTENRR